MKTLTALLIVLLLLLVGCGGGGSSTPPAPEEPCFSPQCVPVPVTATVILKNEHPQFWENVVWWENRGDILIVEGDASFEHPTIEGHIVDWDGMRREYDACEIELFFTAPALPYVDEQPLSCYEGEA